MKTFARRTAIVTGLLFTALLCMGIVYIDSINHYWRVGGENGAYVQLIVSNKLVLSVNTNTGRIGVNVSNANSVSFDMVGLDAATNLTGNGGTASSSGRIRMKAGTGGASFLQTSASGGGGGAVQITSGDGGSVPLATTNATGGAGGTFFLTGGAGGSGSSATNSIIGGAGGGMLIQAGSGTGSSFATTQAVGGAGGSVSMIGGLGATPSGGWSRKGGNGGAAALTGGDGGAGVRTNGGNGGNAVITAGTAGNASTTPAFAGLAGNVLITAGSGGTGDTNTFGGNVIVAGGAGGGGAAAGNVLLGITDGAPQGNVGVRTNSPQAALHVAGDVAMTTAAQPVHLGAANTNNVRQTNWIGTILVLAGATIEADFNLFSEIIQTNRMTGNQQIDLNNASAGYRRMRGAVPGEIAGGTSRTLTFSAPSGQLIIDLDDFAAAPALTKVITVTNGNCVVWDDEVQFLNGTNCHAIVTRQAKF